MRGVVTFRSKRFLHVIPRAELRFAEVTGPWPPDDKPQHDSAAWDSGSSPTAGGHWDQRNRATDEQGVYKLKYYLVGQPERAIDFDSNFVPQGMHPDDRAEFRRISAERALESLYEGESDLTFEMVDETRSYKWRFRQTQPRLRKSALDE
jgi:hypothetical protein